MEETQAQICPRACCLSLKETQTLLLGQRWSQALGEQSHQEKLLLLEQLCSTPQPSFLQKDPKTQAVFFF